MLTAKELLTQLADADNKVATQRAILKQAEQEYEAVADDVFAYMAAQETDAIRNKEVGLQVSVSETEHDTIEDWDDFTRFVLRHKAVHFFHRRLATKAIEEYRNAHPKIKIPGLGKFSRKKLHVTKYE
jgi:hypothetical protein